MVRKQREQWGQNLPELTSLRGNVNFLPPLLPLVGPRPRPWGLAGHAWRGGLPHTWGPGTSGRRKSAAFYVPVKIFPLKAACKGKAQGASDLSKGPQGNFPVSWRKPRDGLTSKMESLALQPPLPAAVRPAEIFSAHCIGFRVTFPAPGSVKGSHCPELFLSYVIPHGPDIKFFSQILYFYFFLNLSQGGLEN